ncbi:MAG: hypothetical protein H0U64_08425 [Gemmatimonadaceae bacterium]|nr:hypothetical protein [Gemmatimonadaceae bacterium]
MSKYILRSSVSLAFAVLAATACGSNDKTADTLAQDTSLNRDLQLANNDSAAQPALTDVPANGVPAPTASAPAPTRTTTPARTTPSRTTPSRTTTTQRPSTSTATTSSGNTVTRNTGAAPSSVGLIAAGSTLNLSSSSRICTNTNNVGDRFTATVRESISGSNGAVIPAGASVQVEVTQLKRSENANDNVIMGFRVVSVSFGGKTYPVSATTSYAQVDKIKNQPSGKDAQKVATGAAIGAIAGQILGKNTKSTVIGGAVGAAAGAGAAAATANYEGCVPSGGRITVTLNSGVTVNT